MVPKIRDALNLFDQKTLVAMAERRDVRGARSNDERRGVLARSYRGDATSFLRDLTRADLLLILRAGADGLRSIRNASARPFGNAGGGVSLRAYAS